MSLAIVGSLVDARRPWSTGRGGREAGGPDHERRRRRGTRCGRRLLLREGHRRRLVLHAGVLQHVGPFAAGAVVAVFEVLAEVVGAEELFGLVALAELVHLVEVVGADVPLRRIGEFFPAVSACVGVRAG